MSTETTYRIRQPKPGPFDTIMLSELIDSKVHHELGNDDPSPKHLIRGEWYCQNTDCPVREVRIHGKWPDGDRPAQPRFVCPSCSLDLKFHGHLTETVLVPVKE